MRTLFYFTMLILVVSACTKPDPDAKETDKVDWGQIEEMGQGKVSFVAPDSIEIVADYYPAEGSDKVIILLHQANFSRAEYKDIAPRLVEAGYSCLAVDLRSGQFIHETPNETNVNALKAGKGTKFQDARQDIKAAIDFAKRRIKKKIVLWGSSYSATLSLMEGRDNPDVVKVVAFSPGVYFSSENTIKAAIAEYHKPVFVTCSKAEIPMVKQLTLVIPEQYLSFYEPDFTGDHGAKVLWQHNEGTDKMFEALVNFL